MHKTEDVERPLFGREREFRREITMAFEFMSDNVGRSHKASLSSASPTFLTPVTCGRRNWKDERQLRVERGWNRGCLENAQRLHTDLMRFFWSELISGKALTMDYNLKTSSRTFWMWRFLD